MQNSRNQLLLLLIQNLRGLYGDLYRARPSENDRSQFAGHNLSRIQTELVFLVAQHKKDGISVKDAAAKLQVTSGAVTQLVDTLITQGLIERSENPNDRRSILLRVTDAVDTDCLTFEAYYTRHVSPMFNELADAEIEQLIQLIGKIKDTNKKERRNS